MWSLLHVSCSYLVIIIVNNCSVNSGYLDLKFWHGRSYFAVESDIACNDINKLLFREVCYLLSLDNLGLEFGL